MIVLVTGAAGYLGSVLVPLLLERGFSVRALDAFFFDINPFEYLPGDSALEVMAADIRTFNPSLLEGADAVIDLAAVAQTDSENRLPPALFYDLNYLAPLRTATLSKLAGVKLYIYASTCSIYGIREDIATEESPVDPTEIYARTKYQAEQILLKMNDDKFSVTALRFATLYGCSPKMRFDLLLNRMVLSACKDKKIFIGGGGEQRRVILHVKDAAKALLKALEADASETSGRMFNIGSNDQNYEIRELADMIKLTFRDSDFVRYGDPDKRSFRVNFDKTKSVLGFTPEYRPPGAIREMKDLLESGFEVEDKHFVIPWWLHLIQQGKIWNG